MVNSLYTEANEIVMQAIAECGLDRESVLEYINESCDGHEIAIYTYKAIKFCADNDTSAGESFLDECGGIAKTGDSFGRIACRVAYATLYIECMELLEESL